MDASKYQLDARETAIYPGMGQMEGLAYVTLGLNGEAGEVAELVKKWMRGDRDPDFLKKCEKELGDVCWYVAMACFELDLDLSGVMEKNIEKLRSRKVRGMLQGNGDDR